MNNSAYIIFAQNDVYKVFMKKITATVAHFKHDKTVKLFYICFLSRKVGWIDPLMKSIQICQRVFLSYFYTVLFDALMTNSISLLTNLETILSGELIILKLSRYEMMIMNINS